MKPKKTTRKVIKVKLIDKYGFTKTIECTKGTKVIHYLLLNEPEIDFELFDVPKKGMPIFRQVEYKGITL